MSRPTQAGRSGPTLAADAVGEAAPLLELKNVEVVYDRVILVLRGVSLVLPAGGMVALLGANGAGKSTTLKVIYNLLAA